MSYKNRKELKNYIGEIGLFYNEVNEKTLHIGKLVSVTKNGNCEDEDQGYYDEFTPINKADLLELIDIDIYT